jgi:uncharacterized Ntn-hydrolase superfamily protein
MTFSIAAYDADTQSWGVAVSSKCLAVGFAVPWGAAGQGAVATQALANLAYGRDGLARLGRGEAAADVVQALVADDPLATQRQVGIVDAAGRAAAYTGPDCLDWKGNIVDGEVTVQGNLLAGPHVIADMLAAYRASADEAFVQRLLHALEAGDAAGGDRRGRQSCAVRVWRAGAAYGGSLDMAVDLRVDDHPDPVAELGRLIDLHDLYFCRPEPGTLIPLDDDLTDEIASSLRSLGYDPDQGFTAAFDRWVGTENYEERNVPGSIDPRVLHALRTQSAGAGV